MLEMKEVLDIADLTQANFLDAVKNAPQLASEVIELREIECGLVRALEEGGITVKPGLVAKIDELELRKLPRPPANLKDSVDFEEWSIDSKTALMYPLEATMQVIHREVEERLRQPGVDGELVKHAERDIRRVVRDHIFKSYTGALAQAAQEIFQESQLPSIVDKGDFPTQELAKKAIRLGNNVSAFVTFQTNDSEKELFVAVKVHIGEPITRHLTESADSKHNFAKRFTDFLTYSLRCDEWLGGQKINVEFNDTNVTFNYALGTIAILNEVKLNDGYARYAGLNR